MTGRCHRPGATLAWRRTGLMLALTLLLAFAGLSPDAQAAAETSDLGLAEEVLMVPALGPGAPELELTLYRPRGPGPFPLAVINHGRSPGPAHMQPRYRPWHAAYEFVRRGYAVVVPMRQGFSRSGGVELDGSCDIAGNARQQARSVRRAVDWAASQPWADATRIVVLGQSQGGMATLAYGEDPHPGTRLLVNFSGGLRQLGCPDWEDALVDALSGLARGATLPSLWFYGDNDSHFRPVVWRSAHGRYVQAGGRATLEAVGTFGSDAHLLFSSRDGVPVWLPRVLERLGQVGMPTQIDTRWDPMLDALEAHPLRQARAEEADRLPVRSQSARQGFLTWLRIAVPKAFAISDNGRHWASAWGMARPIANAIEHCERVSGARCRIFAVNGFIVSSGDSDDPASD